MTDTVGLRLLTVTLTHYPPSAANLSQISPHATFMRPIFISARLDEPNIR